MNIGDKVRFLSETGGGKVAGFQSNNIVLVEDEDGFQIPFPINEVVVVVGEDNYTSSKLVSSKMEAESKHKGIERDGRSIKTLLKDGQDDIDTSLNDDEKYDTVDDEKEITFKIRHTPDFTHGYLRRIGDVYRIRSDKKIQGIAPGQYGVVYDKDHHLCYGSGMIIDNEKQ